VHGTKLLIVTFFRPLLMKQSSLKLRFCEYKAKVPREKLWCVLNKHNRQALWMQWIGSWPIDHRGIATCGTMGQSSITHRDIPTEKSGVSSIFFKDRSFGINMIHVNALFGSHRQFPRERRMKLLCSSFFHGRALSKEERKR